MKYELENVIGFLAGKGYSVLSNDYYSNIYSWIDWYKGYMEKFHTYKMYNGFRFINKKRASLKMPKRVAEEWASLLYNDKVSISTNKTVQKKLDKLLDNNKFNYKFSELLERTFALGTGALVEFKDATGKTKIDYIIAPMVFPLRQDNGEIIDCAFGSIKGDIFYVNVHIENNGIYTISNLKFKIINGKYEEIPLDSTIETTYSSVKLFQIIKPNIANNVDLFSPFGLSVFANGLDQNETIDLIYDSFKSEFDLGKKRLFLRTEALTTKMLVTTDETGKNVNQEVPIFDNDQTEFYALPGEETDDLITEINPELRVTEHIDAIQTALNLFSDSCGLGPDRFIFKDGKVYTNSDQVISTQSKLYKNIVNHEKVLRYAICDMVRALLYLDNGSEYKGDVTIDFDDSIIEDSKETRTQAILELNNGLIDDIQYYIDVYKMTEDQAIAFREAIKERTPQEEPDDEPLEGA